MCKQLSLSATFLTAVLLAACSGAGAPVPEIASDGSYALNDEEKALDCKKLTGRMLVRILQARDFNAANAPSGVSHAFQSAAVMAGSSAKRGLDPVSDHARDRAQLEAYNRRLIELKCKSFNLDDELKPKPVTATPAALAPDKGSSGTTGKN